MHFKKPTISEEFTNYATQNLKITKDDLGFYVMNSVISEAVSEAMKHPERRTQLRQEIWSCRLMSLKSVAQKAKDYGTKIDLNDRLALKKWRKEYIEELHDSLKQIEAREKQIATRIYIIAQLQKKLGVKQQTPQKISEEKQKEVTKKLVKLYQEFNF